MSRRCSRAGDLRVRVKHGIFSKRAIVSSMRIVPEREIDNGE
jgi:hypothetical protein